MNSLVVFLIILAVVIIVHEMGHFFTAKLFGTRVFEFGIGFGPKLLKKEWHGTLYSLNLIPLGGFVSIAGLDEQPEGQPTYEPEESFQSKPGWQRILMVAAGPLMNILLALLIFIFIFSAIGVPAGVSNSIHDVVSGSPAYEAGIRAGDKVVRVNDYSLGKMEKAIEIISRSGGQPVTVVIERNGEQKKLTVEPVYEESADRYLIGIELASRGNVRYNPLVSIGMGIAETFRISVLIVQGIIRLVTGAVSLDQLAGPVRIYQMTAEVARTSIISIVSWLAILSINLGIINLVPFPALDGGRILFLLFETIAGKKVLSARRENYIHYLGFVVLITLILIITIREIVQSFA